MATIKVQPIPKKRESVDDVLATFCYHFPQYTYEIAKQMPYKRVRQMLKVAQKEHARKMLDLLQIICAPHGKKGTVANVFKRFNDIINQ